MLAILNGIAFCFILKNHHIIYNYLGDDIMPHSEYIKIVNNSDTAVLMVHGICSTPRHFDFLLPELSENISVYNILLDGHGKTVADFRKTSMKKWKTQVKNLLDTITKNYKQVYIVGYSMGTLLTMEIAEHYPQIKGMLLLNSPIKIFTKPIIFWRCTKFCFGKVNKHNLAEAATYKDIGITLEPWLFKYLLWIPRFIELLKLSPQCRNIAKNINIPVYALFGEKDELVSIKSTVCFDKNKNATVYKFKESGHCYYEPDFINTAKKCLNKMLSQ